jgi:hypothetical protein
MGAKSGVSNKPASETIHRGQSDAIRSPGVHCGGLGTAQVLASELAPGRQVIS